MKQANEFAEENGMKFIETSAKSNINEIDAFRTLGMELIISAKDDLINFVKFKK